MPDPTMWAITFWRKRAREFFHLSSNYRDLGMVHHAMYYQNLSALAYATVRERMGLE